MKTSLRSLAAAKAPAASAPAKKRAKAAAAPSYRTAATRSGTRQLGGHFPQDIVQAWRILAAEQDMDSQELLAVGMNMVFERFGKSIRAEIISGRRTKRS